jgi:hypothetical protein
MRQRRTKTHAVFFCLVFARYQTGLVTSVSGIRRILVKLRRRPIFMPPKRPPPQPLSTLWVWPRLLLSTPPPVQVSPPPTPHIHTRACACCPPPLLCYCPRCIPTPPLRLLSVTPSSSSLVGPLFITHGKPPSSQTIVVVVRPSVHTYAPPQPPLCWVVVCVHETNATTTAAAALIAATACACVRVCVRVRGLER